jgi:hypothetical protein
MPDNGSNGELNQRINELYWDSDNTVGAISKDLEIGRNALYAALVPVPSGAVCLECGEETVYTNRTNRAAGSAVCRSCEDTAMAGSTGMDDGPGRRQALDAYEEDSELQRWDRWREDLRAVPPQRAAMIGGAAALGLVVGAAAVRAIRNG